MKDRWLFYILLAAPFAFALFFWDVGEDMLRDENTATINDRDVPQTIVEKTELVQFDSRGNAAHWLRSEELLTEQTDGLVRIFKPIINIDPDEENTWDATSDAGFYDQTEKFLRLQGQVTLTKRQQNSSPIVMTTEVLDFFPDRNFAESDTAVIIETQGHRIETSGISVDFNASIYKLKSNVRSSHDPF